MLRAAIGVLNFELNEIKYNRSTIWKPQASQPRTETVRKQNLFSVTWGYSNQISDNHLTVDLSSICLPSFFHHG